MSNYPNQSSPVSIQESFENKENHNIASNRLKNAEKAQFTSINNPENPSEVGSNLKEPETTGKRYGSNKYKASMSPSPHNFNI